MTTSGSRSAVRHRRGGAAAAALVLAATLLGQTSPVLAAPANDDFLGMEWLTDFDRGSRAGSNVGATVQPGEPDHGGDGRSIWFSYRAAATAPTRVHTEGSAFDTVVAVYAGSDLASLVQVAADADGGSDGTSSDLVFDATAGAIYRIAVDGENDETGAVALTWIQHLVPPPANDDVANATELAGATGTVEGDTRSASREIGEPANPDPPGGASVWYRWTAPVSGTVVLELEGNATDRGLAVYAGSPFGSFELVASDSRVSPLVVFGRVTGGTDYYLGVDSANRGLLPPVTGAFELAWTLYPPPANDDFLDAVVVAGVSGELSSSTAGSTAEPGEPSHHPTIPSDTTVWYRWTPPTAGRWQVDASQSDIGAMVAVYTGDSVDALTRVPRADGSTSDADRLVFEGDGSTAYAIAVAGLDGWNVAFDLAWQPAAPANDNLSDATTLPATPPPWRVSNAWATEEPGEADHGGNGGGASVWYRWESPWTGTLSVSSAGDGFGTAIAVYAGVPNSHAGLEPVAAGASDAGMAEAVGVVGAGGSYLIAVDGWDAATGTIDVALDFTPVHDAFAEAQPVAGFGGTWGSTVGASAEPGEPPHAGEPAQASVWFSWTAADRGTVRFDTRESEAPTRLALYTGDDLAGLAAVGADVGPAVDGAALAVDTIAGVTYRIAVDEVDGARGRVGLSVELVPADLPFTDVVGRTFEHHVEWIWDRAITSGCTATRFCPTDGVTRGQMASFLVRALDLPASDIDVFSDDDGTTHEVAINALRASGITFGCAEDRFCPNDPVTRGQMASFLVRALDLPASDTDVFSDDDGTTHEAAINALSEAEVTSGCEAGRFCPDRTVTREQMAAFLRRGLTLPPP